jgi:hydrogenase nickel incorporation protein HypA/HybF
MHELSIALSIVDLAVAEASRQSEGRIVAVHLKIGSLSGVLPDALRSAFELAREQTPLADAVLRIEEIPIVVFCPVCQTERRTEFPHLTCPVCGVITPDVIRGRELEVTALEIESP